MNTLRAIKNKLVEATNTVATTLGGKPLNTSESRINKLRNLAAVFGTPVQYFNNDDIVYVWTNFDNKSIYKTSVCFSRVMYSYKDDLVRLSIRTPLKQEFNRVNVKMTYANGELSVFDVDFAKCLVNMYKVLVAAYGDNTNTPRTNSAEDRAILYEYICSKCSESFTDRPYYALAGTTTELTSRQPADNLNGRYDKLDYVYKITGDYLSPFEATVSEELMKTEAMTVTQGRRRH